MQQDPPVSPLMPEQATYVEVANMEYDYYSDGPDDYYTYLKFEDCTEEIFKVEKELNYHIRRRNRDAFYKEQSNKKTWIIGYLKDLEKIEKHESRIGSLGYDVPKYILNLKTA